MYSLPSAPTRRAPKARCTNTGCPPTARNARTGLFTPPGISRSARSSSVLETESDMRRRLACWARPPALRFPPRRLEVVGHASYDGAGWRSRAEVLVDELV